MGEGGVYIVSVEKPSTPSSERQVHQTKSKNIFRISNKVPIIIDMFCDSRHAYKYAEQVGLARGWGSLLIGLGMLELGLGGLAVALDASSPGFPALWTGLVCLACGASGRAAATAW